MTITELIKMLSIQLNICWFMVLLLAHAGDSRWTEYNVNWAVSLIYSMPYLDRELKSQAMKNFIKSKKKNGTNWNVEIFFFCHL